MLRLFRALVNKFQTNIILKILLTIEMIGVWFVACLVVQSGQIGSTFFGCFLGNVGNMDNLFYANVGNLFAKCENYIVEQNIGYKGAILCIR